MGVDIGKYMGEASASSMGPEEDETDDSLETHLAAYNRAMKSGDMKGMAAAFKAAVAACGGYDTDME